MDAPIELRSIVTAAVQLGEEHRRISSTAQRSKSRVASIEATLASVEDLSSQQSELLRESTQAAAAGLYRAAEVAAFAAVIDGLHERLAREEFFRKLLDARPRWHVVGSEDLREQADFQVIDAAREVGAISRSAAKSFHGLLHRRNQCAHPSGYRPTMDEALGFIGETIQILRVILA